MTRKKYTNISIPEGLTLEVDKFIKNSKLSFSSRVDLTKHALREFILRANKK